MLIPSSVAIDAALSADGSAFQVMEQGHFVRQYFENLSIAGKHVSLQASWHDDLLAGLQVFMLSGCHASRLAWRPACLLSCHLAGKQA